MCIFVQILSCDSIVPQCVFLLLFLIIIHFYSSEHKYFYAVSFLSLAAYVLNKFEHKISNTNQFHFSLLM